MKPKLNKNMGFSLLPFAFIFLFDPGITILDPLPDFIGYAILCLAISNLSDINSRVEDAFAGFRKGILISLMRMVAIYLLDSYFIESEIALGLLLFVFVFSFFELFVLMPAYRCFFEGLLSLGIMHDGCVVYYKKLRKIKKLDGNGYEYTEIKESKRNITEKAYFLTAAFLCVKTSAVTLPEFTSLASNTSYEFVSLLRLFGLVISLIFGFVWLIRIIVYISKVRSDKPFIDNLSRLFYKNAEEKPNFYTVKRVSFGAFVLLLSAAFSVNLYSNYINLIPDYVFYITLFIAALILRRDSKKWKALASLSVVGAVVGFVSHYVCKGFHKEYVPSAVIKNLDAYYSFYNMLIAQILESTVMISTILIIFMMLYDIYRVHSDMGLATKKEERHEHKKRFIKYASVVGTFAVLTAVSNVFYIYAQPFYYTQNWFFYYSAIISVAINFIYMFAMCYFIGYISNTVKYRYRLDL